MAWRKSSGARAGTRRPSSCTDEHWEAGKRS
ncbi:hypothetical protein Egran_06907 [Elaphomyces granulatus]|uniref:Uncharacterized protein n=1 Tax=Elaphomyces granulatus TaxID=519963 RepID=A0A232LMF8_9EURO|nr:hypothetical protein Egran_06907 [Elaphomyces granulatus]